MYSGVTGHERGLGSAREVFSTRLGEAGSQVRALNGLRKDKSPENQLCVLLLHLGCGHSLRATVVRARHAGLADLSSVALMKRLAKSGPWLHTLVSGPV